MSRTSRLLGAVAAAMLLPAAAAPAATFTGTTSGGSTIAFDADGTRVSNVVSAVPMACTSKAGIEPFQPSATFVADGSESKASELRFSAVLNRDTTQNYTFTATIDGDRATGKLAINSATTDFDLFTMTTLVTVCAGSTDFTASAPATHEPAQPQQPAHHPAKQSCKKKTKQARKRCRAKGRA
ncbi:MAG TPA: hypothetical protein VFR97_13320 [Capillimicrobium sp.]|nr:hypothetical protein [Capillimicrobium sp.]